jgi:putative hydrolase of the HAD superfamily
MKYGAAIFDLFGTLVPSLWEGPYRASLREAAAAVGVDPEEFSRLWTDEDVAKLRATGAFPTAQACIENICRRLGALPSDEAVQRAAGVRIEYVRRSLSPRSDAVDTLKKLKAAGLKLGLMSVCSADTPPLWRQTPLAALFDEALLSCQVGLTKPDPRFYALACERLGMRPARCLYVGDGAGDELTGAKRAGMHPVLICTPDEEQIVMEREEARNFRGPKITALAQVLDLLD